MVDDDPASLLMLGRILQAAGYETDQAADGAEALKRIADRPPALVITDMQMPVMDGTELIRHLRATAAMAAIAILAVSAERIGAGLAVDGALRKPYRPEQVLTIVGELLAG